MRKLMAILLTFGLIMGFAGMASAQDVTCIDCEDPSTINRGCIEQDQSCLPFDYENMVVDFDYENMVDTSLSNYCEGKNIRRIVFPICDCPEIANLVLTDNPILDIRLEILVNGETGNNGAYWAETIDSAVGIGAELYSTDDAACDMTNRNEFTTAFVGDFNYLYYDEDGGLTEGTVSACTPGVEEYQVTIIEPDAVQPGDHGLQLGPGNAGESFVAVNIPQMWFDSSIVQAGDEISVQICITPADADGNVNAGNLCGQIGCCCEFTLGDLCCPDDLFSQSLVFPYATAMNDVNWWYGMAITNLSDADGTATITIYEADGDTDSIEEPVSANAVVAFSDDMLMERFGEGIGDQRAYFRVTTDFNADGFFFIGNDGLAEAMGYLPRK